MSDAAAHPLSWKQRFLKRSFDVFASLVGLLLVSPIIAFGWLAATISTGKNGFFSQTRIGKDGQPFRLLKLRSMREIQGVQTTITTATDPRITSVGKFLRRTKIDELPQLFNVLAGQMSFVGPRPDVPGFADKLTGDDAVVLRLRPGITGPASLKFRNEEELLAKQADPEAYNQNVIWSEKVRINRFYAENYSFRFDISCIIKTLNPS